jgi:hypothetical protein
MTLTIDRIVEAAPGVFIIVGLDVIRQPVCVFTGILLFGCRSSLASAYWFIRNHNRAFLRPSNDSTRGVMNHFQDPQWGRRKNRAARLFQKTFVVKVIVQGTLKHTGTDEAGNKMPVYLIEKGEPSRSNFF